MRKHINAEAFFKLINKTLPYRELDYPDKAVYNAAISDVCGMLTHFPPADVQEVRHGKWIEQEADMDTIYECSVCGEPFVTIDGTPADNLWNYCPNCGAQMDLEENDG